MIVRECRRFLEEVDDSRPFFLYLPFNLPHYPISPTSGSCPATPGFRNDTMIIYMSDNGHSTESYNNWGVEYGAHGGGGFTGEWAGHKETFYEGGIRVPAIISWPGVIPAGQTRDQAVLARYPCERSERTGRSQHSPR